MPTGDGEKGFVSQSDMEMELGEAIAFRQTWLVILTALLVMVLGFTGFVFGYAMSQQSANLAEQTAFYD